MHFRMRDMNKTICIAMFSVIISVFSSCRASDFTDEEASYINSLNPTTAVLPINPVTHPEPVKARITTVIVAGGDKPYAAHQLESFPKTQNLVLHSELSGPFPNLPSLQTLELNCPLTTEQWKSILGLKSLRSLWINPKLNRPADFSKIARSITAERLSFSPDPSSPAEIQQWFNAAAAMPRLHDLSLPRRGSDVALSCLRGGSLESVRLFDTDVSNSTANLINQLPNLRKMDLTAVPLAASMVRTSIRAPQLLELVLDCATIDQDLVESLPNKFPNLECLSLRDCSTSGSLDIEPITRLKHLRKLNVSHTDELLKATNIEQIGSMRNLSELNISGADMSDEAQRRISELPSLETVDVSLTKVGDVFASRILRGSQMREVEFGGCDAITSDALKDLKKSRSLIIRAYGTRINRRSADELEKSRRVIIYCL